MGFSPSCIQTGPLPRRPQSPSAPGQLQGEGELAETEGANISPFVQRGKSFWDLLGLSRQSRRTGARDMGGLSGGLGCVASVSTSAGSVTWQKHSWVWGNASACCIYTQNLLACGEEGWEGESGMEHIW